MSKLKVRLLAYTPEPQKITACAAKLCYSPSGIDSLLDNLTEENTDKFLTMLNELGHESPFEHTSYTFGIEGVSRVLLAQITRHRIASYSVKSQRYVREGQFDYVIPPEIEKNGEALNRYKKAMTDCQLAYNDLADILYKQHMDTLLSEGKSENEASRLAEKSAIEDARFVLPNSCETYMVVTMNARSLYNFFSQRCCMRAQWEIRTLACEMLRLVKEAAPVIFKKAGPPCLYKSCPEGKMSCGKSEQVRKTFDT